VFLTRYVVRPLGVHATESLAMHNACTGVHHAVKPCLAWRCSEMHVGATSTLQAASHFKNGESGGHQGYFTITYCFPRINLNMKMCVTAKLYPHKRIESSVFLPLPLRLSKLRVRLCVNQVVYVYNDGQITGADVEVMRYTLKSI
jgi:hypothetical protein